MEIFELRYFLGVAQHENIHRASERLKISPASLSKAVARLEDELSVKLFTREGRQIRLTAHGRLLQQRASNIVRLEEDARTEVGGHAGALQIVLAGPEILLSKQGRSFSAELKRKFAQATFEYHSTDDGSALEQVARGEAHLALVTSEVPADSGLTARTIGEAQFQTFVGKGHPLYSRARAGKTIPVETVLTHAFVSPTSPLLGKVGAKQSLDGWRDDRFPRRIEYRTSSLKTLEEFVVSGEAIAYLPDYFCDPPRLQALRISGCPYSCQQKVRLVARRPEEVSWLNQLF